MLEKFEGNYMRLANNWVEYIPVTDYKPIKYLEIGSYQGGSVISVSESYGKHPETELYCIDPWIDYDGYVDYKGEQDSNYSIFMKNIRLNNLENKVKIRKGFSNNEVPKFEDNYFDIIYIDGNHDSPYVLEDIVLSFRKLKIDGYLIFDDYGSYDSTKIGVDAFLSAYKDHIKIIKMNHNTQVFILKTKDL